MVALLKDDGQFTPMPVVQDTEKLKQLLDSMSEKPKAPEGLIQAIRASRQAYGVKSKQP